MSGALPPRRCCNGTAICGTTLRAETGNLTLKAGRNAIGMLNGMLERIERSEDADAADGYETMLSGGGREF